jgi:hypothetical protein
LVPDPHNPVSIEDCWYTVRIGQVSGNNLCDSNSTRLNALERMIDPLVTRAQVALQESCQIRQERRALMAEHVNSLRELRLSILESAMMRTESKARRDDRE